MLKANVLWFPAWLGALRELNPRYLLYLGEPSGAVSFLKDNNHKKKMLPGPLVSPSTPSVATLSIKVALIHAVGSIQSNKQPF